MFASAFVNVCVSLYSYDYLWAYQYICIFGEGAMLECVIFLVVCLYVFLDMLVLYVFVNSLCCVCLSAVCWYISTRTWRHQWTCVHVMVSICVHQCVSYV